MTDSESSSAAQQETTRSLIPDSLTELLAKSCLVPALSSYLRNDSVLDMARHVPLYSALLQLLRGITVSPTLVPILLPMEEENGGQGSSSGESQVSIESLLEKMKGCVDTYASRLKWVFAEFWSYHYKKYYQLPLIDKLVLSKYLLLHLVSLVQPTKQEEFLHEYNQQQEFLIYALKLSIHALFLRQDFGSCYLNMKWQSAEWQ